MTRWEYAKTALMDVKLMNEFGATGWELVAALQPFQLHSSTSTTAWLYWKRALPSAENLS